VIALISVLVYTSVALAFLPISVLSSDFRAGRVVSFKILIAVSFVETLVSRPSTAI
jgi:hypothetical protein